MSDFFSSHEIQGSQPENPISQGESTSWTSSGVRPALLVNIAGGFLYGYSIGFIPVIFQFNQYLGDCSRYTSQDACDALTYTGCVWVPSNFTSSPLSSNGFCGFPDHSGVNCSNFFSQDECSDSHGGDSCYWRYHKKQCDHLVGWDSNQQGLLAGIQIVGAMIAAATAGPITNKIGRKKSLALAGLITAIACVFFTAGWADKENYAMLLIAELLVGAATGFISVACPMYCGELVSGPKFQQGIGVIFQLFITFGIFFAGAAGLILDPKDDTAADHAHIQTRFQWVIAIQSFTAVIMFPLAWWVPESPLWLRQQLTRAKTENGSRGGFCDDADPASAPLNENIPILAADDQDNNQASPVSSSSPVDGEPDAKESNSLSDLFSRENAIPLLVGLAMASGQQFTGINGILLYAPSIASKLGLSPLLANCAVSFWNFITCLTPIPLVQRFSCRQLLVATTAVATAAVFAAGLGVLPGIFEDDTASQRGVAISGILLYILAYESGIGPCFYVLAQDIFPAKVRALGTSYCIWICFLANALVNWGFPVAMTGLSGGPSGDQNKGLGIMLLIFAGVGFLCTVFFVWKMPKSNSEILAESEEDVKEGS